MSTAARPQRSSFGWGSSSLSRTLARRGPFSSGLTIPPDLQAQAAAQIGSNAAASSGAVEQDAQGRETLFGPVIGGDDGDEDGVEGVEEKGRQREKVGVETVKGWVDKAKANTNEPHPTTTLQSLVNLKRPTLHLAPLSASPSAKHSLKFTYDLSAPQALLTLHLYLPSPTPSSHAALTEEVVYQAIVPGGFGKTWALPEEAALDLAACQAQVQDAVKTVAGWEERQSEDDGSASGAKKVEGVVDESHEPGSQQAEPRRGFGRWFARRPEEDIESQQVQMAALNLSKGGPNDNANKKAAVRTDVRLVVRLEARGERGEALGELNAQRTHVDIAFHPAAPSTPASTGTDAAGEVEAPLEAGPDGTAAVTPVEGGVKKDYWSAKVVRREALIGNHTFQLKEIFGLTSSAAPAAEPVPATYPPQPTSAEDMFQAGNAPNECIVCLVSPRDVVLLPCRHLVVCKECAVGMVEFGAGGKVMRREEGGGELGGDGAEAGAAAPAADGTTPTGGADATEVRVDAAQQARQEARRRRKAKGWFCPVCRQPYTSLLRIALPSSKHGLQRTITAVSSHSHPSHDASHSGHGHGTDLAALKEGAQTTEEEVPASAIARAPSPVPTLPGRAASVLYPDEDDDDEREIERNDEVEQERPQFVLGDDGEDETERRKKVEASA